MRLITILFCTFLALQAYSKQSFSTYLIPTISGTGMEKELSSVAGINHTFKVLQIETDNPESFIRLKWKHVNQKLLGDKVLFRICLATDLRSFQKVEVNLAESKMSIDVIDLTMGAPFQLLELEIPRKYVSIVIKKGVDLRIIGKGPAVSFFIPCEGVPESFFPHLLQPGNVSPLEEFYVKMASLASLSSYGWQEGCVIDGLADLHKKFPDKKMFKVALDTHLDLLFPENTTLKHENSIEETSCIAQLALRDSKSIYIDSVLHFWKSKEDVKGMINDERIAAEGNYTVAWPLAVIAKQLHRPDLAEKAIRELRMRRDSLVDKDGVLWLRHKSDDRPQKTYKLWSRGTAWYFLGLARTLDILENPPADLIAEYQRSAAFLVKYQRDNGMFHIFMEEDSTAFESSGTAGVAAALAIGIRNNWIGKEYLPYITRALAGLENRLTPDGFLKGTAQTNKAEGGETFQRATNGAILQFGMGMFAQLIGSM
jgi:unsaturated rhamnogalacturonyl hydrolase